LAAGILAVGAGTSEATVKWPFAKAIYILSSLKNAYNSITMTNLKKLTKSEVEGRRGELFHMILFSLAWALIGEYLLNFRDYAVGAGLVLLVVIRLALYSIKFYDLEEDIKDDFAFDLDRKEIKQDRSYALILLFEGVAILVSWVLLLNFGHENWLISAFALIAGLHFFPLAKVIHQNSYYFLGIWICILAIGGYLLISSGKTEDYIANTIVAYGCAAGSLVDGIVIMRRTRKALRQS
jgi:hypothetical protein